MKKIISLMAGILIGMPIFLIILTPFIAYSCFSYGYALTYLWEWYVVPIFNCPSLKIWSAAGLALTVKLFTYQAVIVPDSRKESEKIAAYIGVAATPWITLLIGYIIHKLM